MESRGETLIRISPERAEIIVERNHEGVVSRKTIAPETLTKCFLTSRYDDEKHETGLLPEHCIAVTMTATAHFYYIRCPDLHTDFTYYGTELINFPIPRLVFGFKYAPDSGKVTDSSVCVVRDERLTPDTPTYHYPFSNVFSDNRICMGNNALPVYKSPTRLTALASYILRIPNNNDQYSNHNNKLNLEYRDLLEQMKGKDPSHYYTDILIPDGRTLKDFMNRR